MVKTKIPNSTLESQEDTSGPSDDTPGQMNAQYSHETGSNRKRMFSELLHAIPFLRGNNIEPAQKQNITPEMIQ